MQRVTIASVALLVLLAVEARPARAEVQDRAVARMHFDRGVTLYEAGSYQAALDEFQAAYEAQPHPAVLVNIANCFARTGRPVRAIRAFERYLRETGARVSATERADIERVMGEQRRLVGELRIEVRGLEGQLLVDGLPVGDAPTVHTELVEAGPHRIEVRPATGSAIVRQATVAGGATATVVLEPAATPSPTPTPTPPSGDPPAPWEEGGEPPPVEPPPSADEPPARAAVAVLEVTGTRGAAVHLDGRRIGRVPFEGEVEPGERRLRLSGSGLSSYETTLDLAPGERTTVRVDLTRGRRPAWLPWTEWSLVGLAGALVIPGIAVAAVGWGRYQDSEAMFTEIGEGRYSSRPELDLMWGRYDELYGDYESTWAAGWALIGVGLAAGIGAVTLFILDRRGSFGGRPSAEIDIVPIGEDSGEDVLDL